MVPVFRFAPSPNGYLHLGHALSALLNFDMARASGGRLLLRIEDIDATRCRPDYEPAIYEDLAWLGIAWEEPVRRQSEHFDDYRAGARRGSRRTGSLYPSFESRGRDRARWSPRAKRDAPWPRDPDGAPLYPGDARKAVAGRAAARIASGAPYALRLDMAAAIARAGRLTLAGGIFRKSGNRFSVRMRPLNQGGETGEAAPPIRRAGATSCSRARRRRRAITSPSWSTTPCRASPRWCAAPICSGRPACTGCCRRCSTCRRPTTTIIGCCSARTAASCRNRRRRRRCAACASKARRPADIRRMVGLG